MAELEPDISTEPEVDAVDELGILDLAPPTEPYLDPDPYAEHWKLLPRIPRRRTINRDVHPNPTYL